MKIAILIHAHTNPNQLARLVSKLRHKDVDIYVNIDGKVAIDSFEQNVENVVFLNNRVEVFWGRFSQLEQILNSFEEISKQTIEYSHILFISGLDYPIVPISDIVDYLNNNKNKSFIDHYKLGNDDWSRLMKSRFEYWYFLPENDIRNNIYVKKVFSKLGFKRRYPFDNVYYGSCWFTLSSKTVNYLLEYTQKNPKVLNFFKHTACADELYIQSVLLNSPIKSDLEKEIYRFFDWGDKGKSPKVLTVADYPQIEKSNAWFARKIDENVDVELLNMLDNLNSKNR